MIDMMRDWVGVTGTLAAHLSDTLDIRLTILLVEQYISSKRHVYTCHKITESLPDMTSRHTSLKICTTHLVSPSWSVD